MIKKLRDFLQDLFSSYEIEGMSYIQILLGSTALAALALLGIQLSKDQKALAEKTLDHYEMSYLVREVSYLLENTKNCEMNFKGKNPNTIFQFDGLFSNIRNIETNKDITILRLQSKAKGGTFYGQGDLVLQNYSLSAARNPEQTNQGITEIIMTFKVRGKKEKKRFIPIYFDVDEDGRISSCSSRAQDKEAEAGWLPDDTGILNLKKGKVGIGIERPLSGLHLKGALKLSSHPKAICQKSSEGSIRYNGELKIFELCRELKWHSISGVKEGAKQGTLYSLELSKREKKISETKKHQFCFLRSLDKSTAQSGCNITKRNNDQKTSVFDLEIFSYANAVNINCEVWCFD